MVGKVPCEKDKFARLDIRTEKTPEQDLRSEVGMKSSGEDLAGFKLRIIMIIIIIHRFVCANVQ